jgi:hypothetical protein
MRTLLLPFVIVVLSLTSSWSASTARAAEEDPIQNAIKKGSKYLQGLYKPLGADRGKGYNMGGATLAGMALLESGVPETDPALKAIIHYVRDNALSQTGTYQISLTIMFLDRLGQANDRPIIQFLGVRLMGGQLPSGGWSYQCGYDLTAQDEARLKSLFIKETRLVSTPGPKGEPGKKTEPGADSPRPDLKVSPLPDPKALPAKKGAPATPKPADDKLALHPEVIRFAKLVSQNMGADNGGQGLFGGDNSNTQFATLGLWCARKHGLPCDRSFALLEARFRKSQDKDGGWSYVALDGGNVGSTPAMTCAGLIALATAHGMHQAVLRTKPDLPAPKVDAKNDPENDQAIKKGLKCLGDFITDAKGKPPEGKIKPGRQRVRFRSDNLNSNLYFLWSLERVGVIYGLETIGNHDWYVWGSDALVDAQGADGSWQPGGYPGGDPGISTCLALLFLNRANVARDLTAALRGKVGDPGTAVLRGGGDIAKVLPTAGSPKAVPAPEPKRDPNAVIEPKQSTVPPARVDDDDFRAQASRLANVLLTAAAEARPGLLAQLRDSKGSVYTEALARVCAKATGEFQREVREAFARRLARMTAATLRDMLGDENVEVRCAAASACGRKQDKQFIADLIAKLNDGEAIVVQASRSSLQGLTGKDFGPDPTATAPAKAKAIAAWQAWAKGQGN